LKFILEIPEEKIKKSGDVKHFLRGNLSQMILEKIVLKLMRRGIKYKNHGKNVLKKHYQIQNFKNI
jgi:hypothetical protein